MRKHSLLLLMVSALTAGLLLPAIPASATPPTAVHFDVPTSFGVPSDFTVTGPAVDAGVVCPNGQANDVFQKASGFQSGVGVNFLVVKEFVCADGSGSFTVKLQVRLDFRAGTDNFNWVILGGSDDYVRLHGSGSGVGVDAAENFVRDVYDGVVHID